MPERPGDALQGLELVHEAQPTSGEIRERLRQLRLERLLEEVEMPLIEVLATMERAGIRVDTKRLERYMSQTQASRSSSSMKGAPPWSCTVRLTSLAR